MVFLKNIPDIAKNRKTVFAKSFHLRFKNFPQKEIFDFLLSHPHFPEKPFIFHYRRSCNRGASAAPENRDFQGAPRPPQCTPAHQTFRGAPFHHSPGPVQVSWRFPHYSARNPRKTDFSPLGAPTRIFAHPEKALPARERPYLQIRARMFLFYFRNRFSMT